MIQTAGKVRPTVNRLRFDASEGKRQTQATIDDLYWTTDHHDVQNTGHTNAVGPADSGGSCRAAFFKQPGGAADGGSGEASPVAARFFSTGVGSSDNQDNAEYLYFGGTDNVLRVVSGSARVTSEIYTYECNMTSLNPAQASPGVLGITASPAAWDVNNEDRLAVVSGDGYLYILDSETCLSDPSICVEGANGGVGAVRSGGRAGAPPCLLAAIKLPDNRVGVSAPRYLSDAQSGVAGGLVLVVASRLPLDSGANGSDVLVAYRANSTSASAPLWTFDPAAIGQGGAVMRGMQPALLPSYSTDGSWLFMPAGKSIAVLNARNGQRAPAYTSPGAAFASSPVLTSDGKSLFVHTLSGSLMKVTVGIQVSNSSRTPTLTPSWACAYSQADWDAGRTECAAFSERTRTWDDESLFTEQRQYRLGSTGEVIVASAGEFASPSFISRRAQAQADASHPLAAAPTLGDFPLSTPALVQSEKYVVFPQYLSIGSGDQGLFVADAGSGAATWAFFNQSFTLGPVSVSLPFGRSRSSPAVDGKDAVYVGADIDWPFADDPQGNDTMPTLFTFAAGTAPGTLTFVWSWNMGSEADVPLGAASPIVRVGVFNDNEVLMTAFDGSVSITEGALCGTGQTELECSGRGLCDCARGVCECQECYSGRDCAVYDKSCGAPAAAPVSNETIAAAVGLPLGLLLLACLSYACKPKKGGWASLLPSSVAARVGLQNQAYASVPLVGTDYGAVSGTGTAGAAGGVKDWSRK